MQNIREFRSTRSWSLQFLLPFLLLAFSSQLKAQDFAVAQTYYVPIPENEMRVVLNELNPNDTGLTIQSIVSIVVSQDQTVIVYDHYEDGYEADIANPTMFSSTEIWGDGDLTNGIAPGSSDDILSPGNVIVLDDVIAVTAPTDPANPFDNGAVVVPADFQFNGRDKFASNRPLAVTRAGWAPNPGPVLAGAVEVFPVAEWGVEYISPVGENVPDDDNIFELVTGSYMATEDNTDYTLFVGGVPSFSTVLDEGETLLIPVGFDVPLGAKVITSKPVQLHAITGDIGTNWESRWQVVLPREIWGSELYVPVATRTADTADPTDAFVYNPNANPITVNCEALSDCTDQFGIVQNSAVVAAESATRFRLPYVEDPGDSRIISGARFSADGDFYAIVVVDANQDIADSSDDSDRQNRDYDWGFAAIPAGELSTQIVAGYAPQIDFTSSASPDPALLGSPLWIMAAGGDTTIFVDFNGDGEGANTDSEGNRYDISVSLSELQTAKIFDPDGDNTGTLVYTLDGVLIAAAWGQDPSSSTRQNPYLDAGTFVPAAPLFSMTKSVDLALVMPGEMLIYTIEIVNTSRATLPNVNLQDSLPPGVTYVPGSMTVDGGLFPDGGTFPLASGVDLGSLASGATLVVSFVVTVDADIVMGVDPTNRCPDPETALINNAIVSAVGFSIEDDALTCVVEPPDPPKGGEGCTPGYWKQPHHFDSWTTYSPDDLFVGVFGEDAFPGLTLLEVLRQGGGGLNALGRHIVAALLNAASSDVDYDESVAGVIEAFAAVYPGSKHDYNELKDLFESFNEQGCPLN